MIESKLLNPSCTFNNFQIRTGNRFAVAAAKAVTENPGIAFNPLILYGSDEEGKTNLLHTIGNEINQNNGISIRIAHF